MLNFSTFFLSVPFLIFIHLPIYCLF